MIRERADRTRSWRIKIWQAGGASLLIAAAALIAWAAWPQPAVRTAPQARRYLNVTACLLTDPSGITPGAPAAPIWAAMQAASLSTHVMVSYLPDTGPADVPDMINTLIQRQCGVIIATGTAAAADRVIKAAKGNPRQRFLLVLETGTVVPEARKVNTARGQPPNAITVSASDAPQRIGQVIRALATHSALAGS